MDAEVSCDSETEENLQVNTIVMADNDCCLSNLVLSTIKSHVRAADPCHCSQSDPAAACPFSFYWAVQDAYFKGGVILL